MPAKRKVTKTKNSPKKKVAKKKSPRIKAKKVVAKPAVVAAPAEKPVAKVHPFAQFMKGRISHYSSTAPVQKLLSHDTYRKKAI